MENLNESQITIIQQSISSLFRSLPKKGKPQDKEWSVFASLLSINSSNVVNIHSFATGNKSLPSSLYNIDVINDSHAEVLCKRGFQIFLMDELLHPTFLQWNKYLNQYEWNNKHQLILYISQPPCGDCCISNNKTDSGAKRIINNSINNTVALWEEDDIESSLGSTRIKPGKGEKSLSMSCSDKIVKWGVLGLQGGYLSNYISPITIQTILIEEPNDIKAIHRGLHDRILNFSSHFLSNNIDLKIKPPHCYSIPSISLITHYSNDLPASGSAINYIMNNKEEVTIGTRGIKFGAPKKIVEAHRSRLCRRKMIDKYLKVIEQRKQEEETTEPHKTKQQKYLNNKQMMYDTIKGGWTKKATILNIKLFVLGKLNYHLHRNMPRTHGINLSLPIDIHDPTFLTKKNTLKDVVVDLFKSHQTMSQTLQKVFTKGVDYISSLLEVVDLCASFSDMASNEEEYTTLFDSVRSGVESQRELLMKLVDWKIQVDSDMKTQQSAFEKEEKLYNQTCNKYDKLFTKATRNKISCEEFIEIEKQTKLSTFQFCTHLNSTLQNLSSIFSRNGLLFVRNFSTYANNVHNLTVPPTTIPAIQLVQLELPENYSLPSHYGGLLVSKGGVCPSGKRYYNITNGNFVWYDENNNENIISEVMLIAVKPLPDIHSIEFFAPKGKSILYAPTTFEMNRWIEMFEKCKTDSSCYTESLRPTGESIIKMLRKIPGNDRCAECGKRDPDWMSATLGVIICLECSGAHRSLGVRTSRVKSILLDSIDADFILLLKKLGNSYINTTYLQSNRYICSPNATGPQRYASIREKYVIKKFMKSNNDDNGMDMTLTLQSNDIKKLMELLVHLKPGNIPKDAVVTACKMGHLDAVALLLLHGADVNGTDEDGNTGLHVAVMNQNSRMLATIMRHSPTLTVENKVNQSPIQLVSCAPFGNAQAIFDRYQQQQSPAPLSAETEEIHIAEILKEEM